MKFVTFVIFFLMFYFVHQNELDQTFSIVEQYSVHSNVRMVHFFTCWSKIEEIYLSKLLSKQIIRIAFIKNQKSANDVLSKDKYLAHYAFILDLDCQKWSNLLNTIQNRIVFRLARPWLILYNSYKTNSLESWEEFFQDIKIRMDSNIKLAPKISENSSMINVYNPGFKLGGTPKVSKYTPWGPESFYLQRKDMSSVVIRTGSVVLIGDHSETFEEYMGDSLSKHQDTMSKFHYPIFRLLEEVHNFSHTLQIEDVWFGNYQNGSDGGIGKLLYEDKIDITCTGASQRPPRYDLYDYLAPSYHFRPCYIFRNPGVTNPLSDEFLKPFTYSVWWVILIVTTATTVVLKAFFRIENKFLGSKTRYSWAAAILVTVSTLFQQGSSLIPISTGGRLSYAVLLVTAILLYNYYTSSIISSLLSRPPDAFKTLDQLGHSSLEIGIENLPYTITWFKIMNDSDVQYINKHKVAKPEPLGYNFYGPEEGIAKVAKGGFAYHTQLDTGYPIIARTFDQDAICDLNEIPMIPQVFAGTMVQKKSQFKELFQVTLRKAKQAGLIHRIAQIWESEKPQCLASAIVKAVGSSQTFMAFLCLFIGMGVSVIILLVEIVAFVHN